MRPLNIFFSTQTFTHEFQQGFIPEIHVKVEKKKFKMKHPSGYEQGVSPDRNVIPRIDKTADEEKQKPHSLLLSGIRTPQKNEIKIFI